MTKVVLLANELQDIDPRLENIFAASDFSQQKIAYSQGDYTILLSQYTSFQDCDLLVVASKNLNLETTEKLLYAMSLNKKIIVLAAQAIDIYDNFLSPLLKSNLSKLTLGNLLLLDDEDRTTLILSAIHDRPSFRFTKIQTTLLRSRIKARFKQYETSG